MNRQLLHIAAWTLLFCVCCVTRPVAAADETIKVVTQRDVGVPMRDGDWKLIHFYKDDRSELFNLKTDPAETQDLFESQLERARELRAMLDKWRESTGANAPASNPNWRQ